MNSVAANGLLVVGVGRSGTSVATRLAMSLGLRGPADHDLMPANEANPGGYWESNSLAVLNDRILGTWNSTWWTPPREVTSEMTDHLREWQAGALKSFERSFGLGPNWVWKDPRLTVLLGFWTRLLGPQPVLVPVRSPQAVAASVASRDRIPYDRALHIWERHTRNLLRSIEGRTVLLLEYEQLLREPVRWIETLFEFCQGAGLHVNRIMADLSEVDGRPGPTDGPLSDRQHKLLDLLRELRGRHDRFPKVHLGPETAELAPSDSEEFDVERVRLLSAPRGSAVAAVKPGITNEAT